MDVPDVFLAIVKIFNYLHLEQTQDVMFVIFIAIWTWVFSSPVSMPLLQSIPL
jgi:hypothetical protein